jgi:exodeoxyribonuclease VII large subunit
LNLHPQSLSHIYTVSKLTQEIKYLLEERYDIVWISGEISNIRIPSSGHAYFTLKDDKAQISAVMFKGQLRQVKFDLEDGVTIVAMGRISVYEPRGNYQIILEYVEPKGIGALQIAFEQLKRKLADEGLFDDLHKKPLPFLPRKIAVITSVTGAVLQDILKIIRRRFINIAIDIYPVHVQGEPAADEIVNALNLVNKQNDTDVAILARGGGSMEDLAAFNTEIVARAIFLSVIPVVSAVGHETDFTIADFVADLRAPTPSAAAELVVPVKEELVRKCRDLRERCRRSVVARIGQQRRETERLKQRLVHPQKRIQELQQRLDDLHQRLMRNMTRHYQWRIQRYMDTIKLLFKLNPKYYISICEAKLDILNYKLSQLIGKNVEKHRMKLENCRSSLEALSPLAVLKRGYSITRALPRGNVVSAVDDVELEQPLEVIIHKGILDVKVTGKKRRLNSGN